LCSPSGREQLPSMVGRTFFGPSRYPIELGLFKAATLCLYCYPGRYSVNCKALVLTGTFCGVPSRADERMSLGQADPLRRVAVLLPLPDHFNLAPCCPLTSCRYACAAFLFVGKRHTVARIRQGSSQPAGRKCTII
jgi:hypothetical protein